MARARWLAMSTSSKRLSTLSMQSSTVTRAMACSPHTAISGGFKRRPYTGKAYGARLAASVMARHSRQDCVPRREKRRAGLQRRARSPQPLFYVFEIDAAEPPVRNDLATCDIERIYVRGARAGEQQVDGRDRRHGVAIEPIEVENQMSAGSPGTTPRFPALHWRVGRWRRCRQPGRALNVAFEPPAGMQEMAEPHFAQHSSSSSSAEASTPSATRSRA